MEEVWEGPMKDQVLRREFLKTAVVGGAAAASPNILTEPAQAQAATAPPPQLRFLNLDEAAFVETLVNHMVPPTSSPEGHRYGINVFIDARLAARGARATASICKGHGSRVCRARLSAASYTGPASIAPASRRRMRIAPRPMASRSTGSITSEGRGAHRPLHRQDHFRQRSAGPRVLDHAVSECDEGMFSDPIYGGNRNKAGWRLIAFPA